MKETGDEWGGQRQRRVGSWEQLLSSVPPTTHCPPLLFCPARSERSKRKSSAEGTTERELSHACSSSAGLRNSGTFGVVCSHTHILTNTHAGVPVVIQISAGLWEREDKTERVGEEWGRKELFLWTIGAGWHLPWEECLWGTEDWNQDQAEEPAADGGEGFILYLF